MFRLITLANRSVARVQSARDASVARRGLFMSYVNSVLQPGERIIMRGHLHWIVYWHAILFTVLAIVLQPGAGQPAWVWWRHSPRNNKVSAGRLALRDARA